MFQLILFALLFGLFVYRRMKQMSILERSGIPGPKPNLITGNFIDYNFKPNVVVKLSEYREKYGKIFGYYLGGQAVVNVLDLDLIQQIQIKNFSDFLGKSPVSGGYRSIANQSGDVWKANRAILSGDLNGAKFKAIPAVINSTAKVLMDKVEEQSKLGDEFNIHDHLKPLAMDVISKTTMGVDADFQNNPKAVERIFPNESAQNFVQKLSQVISDFVNAPNDPESYGGEDAYKFVSNALDSKLSTFGSRMSRVEAVDNMMYENVSGSQLTSSALAFTLHFLVNHPEVQAKVRKEITDHLTEGKFDQESMSKLIYLQAVINETLRCLPPSTNFVTRTSSEDFHYKDIVLPKNSLIQVPLYQLHHTEEYWPKHDQFIPDRFLDKSNLNSIAFQPFGAGPRICLGARFAMLQMKLILAQLLSKYEFVPGPSTEKELTLKYTPAKEAPAKGVWLKAVPLN